MRQNPEAPPEPAFTIELYPPRPRGTERILDARVIPALSQPGASPFSPPVLYVAPTRRKAGHALHYVLEKHPRPLFGKPVVTLNEFISMLYKNGGGAALLTPAARLAVIEDILKTVSPKLKFLQRPERHPGHVRKLAEIFSTLKQNNIFTSAQLRKTLSAGRVPADKARDLEILFNEYNLRLQPEHNSTGAPLHDEEDALAYARNSMANGGFQAALPHVRLLVLDGFYDFNPLQRALLKQVIMTAPRAVATIELEQNHSSRNRGRDRIFKLPEKNLAFYKSCRPGASVQWMPPGEETVPAPLLEIASTIFQSGPALEQKPNAGGRVAILSPRDPNAEITEVARRIKKLAADKIVSLSRIAVVIPDLESYAPIVREIFTSHGVPFSEAAGRPLASSPVCAAISGMIETITSGYSRQALFRFLAAPFAIAPALPGAIIPLAHEIDLIAREAGITAGGPAHWISSLDNLEKRLLSRVDKYESSGRDASALTVKIDSIRNCRRYLNSVFSALKPLSGQRNITPSEFESLLTGAISSFGFRRLVSDNAGPASPGAACNIAALLEIERIISQLRIGLELSRPASGENKTFPVRDLFDILAAEFSGARVHTTERSPGGVQVMGLLETRGLSFDAVFLCGITDNSLPRKSKEPDFFLTSEERRSCSIESIRSDISEDRLLFHKLLLCGAKTITVTRPAWIGDKETQPSAFVGELLKHSTGAASRDLLISDKSSFYSRADCVEAIAKLSPTPNGPQAAAASAIPPDFLANIALRTDIEASRQSATGFPQYRGRLSGPFHLSRISDAILPNGGSISVTRLENFARCPFGFFLSTILGIEPMPGVEEEISPMDRGLLLHGVIEKFYADRYDPESARITPIPNDPAEILSAERAILPVALNMLEEHNFRGSFWNAFKDSLLTGLDGYSPSSTISYPGVLKSFIYTEAADIDWLKPAYFESEFSQNKEERTPLKLSGPALKLTIETGREIFIRGKIDRIDILRGEQNLFIIIDYKTGAPRTGANLASGILNGADLQLPLYIIMARDALGENFTPAGAALYTLSREPLKSGKSAWFARQDFKDDKATGAKPINTRSKNGFFPEDAFNEILNKIRSYCASLCSNILNGRFDNSLAKKDFSSCQYCDMNRVCRAETLDSPLDNLLSAEKD